MSRDAATQRLKAAFQYDYNHPDVRVDVEVSSNLSSWTPIARSEGNSFTNLGGAFSITQSGDASPYNIVILDNTLPSPTASKRYMRVKVTQL